VAFEYRAESTTNPIGHDLIDSVILSRPVADGINVLPDNVTVFGHFEDMSMSTRADERIAIGQPLDP